MLQNRDERMQVLVSISIVVLFLFSNIPAAVLIYTKRANEFDDNLGYQVTYHHPSSTHPIPLDAKLLGVSVIAFCLGKTLS